MGRVQIAHAVRLYSLMLILIMGVKRIFEGSWNVIDGAIFSGLWTTAFLLLILSIEKISAKHREPYIIGDSTEIEYLTPKELEKKLQKKKQQRQENQEETV